MLPSDKSLGYLQLSLRDKNKYSLNRHRFLIFSPNRAKCVTDLADGHVRFNAIENSWQEVLAAGGGVAQRRNGYISPGGIALGTNRTNTLDLFTFDTVVYF